MSKEFKIVKLKKKILLLETSSCYLSSYQDGDAYYEYYQCLDCDSDDFIASNIVHKDDCIMKEWIIELKQKLKSLENS